MYIFVPAPDQKNPWHSPSLPHFEPNNSMMFDSVLGRAQMFHQLGEDTLLLMLNYAPHLRLSLNNYRMTGVKYISFFDWLQGFEDRLSQPIQLEDLSWPPESELIYTPYHLLIKSCGQIYAQVNFSHQGTIIYVDFFSQGNLEQRVYLDDRGYYSMTEDYRAGEAIRRVYVDHAGKEVLIHHLENDSCELTKPYLPAGFHRHYAHLKDLLADYLDYVMAEAFSVEDILIVGSHQAHNDLFIPFSQHRKLVFAFSSFDSQAIKDWPDIAGNHKILFLVDNQSLKSQLEAEFPQLAQADSTNECLVIPAFDSRFELGKSSQIRENEIIIIVNNMPEQAFQEMIRLLKTWLPDEKYVLNFISFSTKPQFKQLVNEWQAEYSAEQENDDLVFDETEEIIHWHEIRDDAVFMKLMATARMMIDVGTVPQAYAQMAAISVGIPQVNRQSSEFVHHGKNGYLIDDLGQLPRAISYFTDDLEKWNQALIYNVRLIETYGSHQLVPALKQKFEEYFYDYTH
ncbi:accessory Sec system protein Asp1 [Ignavigranum ruoffiae]|uniref:accessory Sec system protein Asp1 n=1 Tax=Ignavigranum ruoffiae TaxID=89093 RepID=UPI0024ADDAB4|nr:accessory Sec system protein Asp1 [Ignavigranum ruoffiae]